MAYSSLWCRLNKVSFTFTMTSSKTRPEDRTGKMNKTSQLCPNHRLASLLLTLKLNLQGPSKTPLQNLSHRGNFSGNAGVEEFQGWGAKHSYKGQARTEQVTVVLWQFSPNNQAKEGAPEVASERQWSFSGRTSASGMMPTQYLIKLGITSHLEERCPRHRGQPISLFTQGETINLHLHQDRSLRLWNCSWDSILASEMSQWKVLRFIY